MPPLFIEIPAWNPYYVDIACRYTVPAVLASLSESPFSDVTFFIHTDDEPTFRDALPGQKIEFLKVAPQKPGRDQHWFAFKEAHQEAVRRTPQGGVLTLLNSDIVVSWEAFRYVADALADGAKTIVSVGIRTTIEGTEDRPPIGVDADELFQWIWAHQHKLTSECVWGSGRSHHPTVLYFPDGKGNMSLHGFHLTPMFILKDRPLKFSGTIDDDLLESYKENEIRFLTGGEVAFCEISPNWKTHPFGRPLTVNSVLEFDQRRRLFRKAHVRNFRQRMRVLGEPTETHPAALEIIDRIAKQVVR